MKNYLPDQFVVEVRSRPWRRRGHPPTGNRLNGVARRVDVGQHMLPAETPGHGMRVIIMPERSRSGVTNITDFKSQECVGWTGISINALTEFVSRNRLPVRAKDRVRLRVPIAGGCVFVQDIAGTTGNNPGFSKVISGAAKQVGRRTDKRAQQRNPWICLNERWVFGKQSAVVVGIHAHWSNRHPPAPLHYSPMPIALPRCPEPDCGWLLRAPASRWFQLPPGR